MPPPEANPESAIRYLTRILAVLAQEAGGELRIKRAKLRKITEESFRLFEDVDDKKDEIVLRFDAKHSAIYPVEAECKQPQPNQPPRGPSAVPVNATPSPTSSIPPALRTGSTLPFTDQQLRRAELKIKQMQTARAIRSEETPQ